MKIELLGTESLGVRGLCCFVRTGDRKILIDPGIALGYVRHGLLPHPCQAAADEMLQEVIIEKWKQATDIIFSHFHGDHVPLADANPYQLSLNKLKDLDNDKRFWTRKQSNRCGLERKRADDISRMLKIDYIEAEGREFDVLTFSEAVPHGDDKEKLGTVVMTKITDTDRSFVHASDNQLLNDKAVRIILEWAPDIVFSDGPPIYLTNRISKAQLQKAHQNALRLAQNIKTVVLDHHLLRCRAGLRWLQKLSETAGKKILCAADFMGKPRMMLEAERKKFYDALPVPNDWHKKYAAGKADLNEYRKNWNRKCSSLIH